MNAFLIDMLTRLKPVSMRPVSLTHKTTLLFLPHCIFYMHKKNTTLHTVQGGRFIHINSAYTASHILRMEYRHPNRLPQAQACSLRDAVPEVALSWLAPQVR